MTDREAIRRAAAEYMEQASRPEMKDRALAWNRLHDLKPIRPVCMFESFSVQNFVTENELFCTDPGLRALERYLRHCAKHVRMFNDDMILKPYYEVEWQVKDDGIGVDIQFQTNDFNAVISNHPIQTPDDLKNLRRRNFTVDRESTLAYRDQLNGLFGDILPVRLNGPMYYIPAVSKNVFDLIGMDNLYFWLIDEPDALNELISFVAEDALSGYKFREKEGILGYNNYATIVLSGSYGMSSDLPQRAEDIKSLKDVWLGLESQETTTISPDMFEEFFLPSMAKIAKEFGLIYYGCCEQLHDRFDRIEKQIKNIRGVSISPWSDPEKMDALLGEKYVFSKKLTPAPISGPHFEFDKLEAEVDRILSIRQNRPLEFLFRDVYDINGDLNRIKTWVDMCRSKF